MRQYQHTDFTSPVPLGRDGEVLTARNLRRQDRVFTDVAEARITEGWGPKPPTIGRFRARATAVAIGRDLWRLTLRVYVTGEPEQVSTQVVPYERGSALAARCVVAAVRGMEDSLPEGRQLSRVL